MKIRTVLIFSAVALLIFTISKIMHAEMVRSKMNKKPCAAGMLNIPPRGWIYLRNHLPR